MSPSKIQLVMIGAPGSGKGTMARRLEGKLGIPHISTGDMLREHVTAEDVIGLAVKSIVERGDLVPDSLLLDMLSARLNYKDCERGFILDGFPRTIEQAVWFYSHGFSPTAVLLEVSEGVCMTRIAARQDGRMDDRGIQTVRDRIQTYETVTKRVISFYEDLGTLVRVNSDGKEDAVYIQMMEKLDGKLSANTKSVADPEGSV